MADLNFIAPTTNTFGLTPDYFFIPDAFFEPTDIDQLCPIESSEKLLQKLCKDSSPEILCCITVYNESAEALLYSLAGIKNNIDYLASIGKRFLARKITICIIFDGRDKMSPSAANLIEDLKLYDPEKVKSGAGVHIFDGMLDNKRLKHCTDLFTDSELSDKHLQHIYRTAQEYDQINSSDYIEEQGKNKEQLLPRVLLCIKEHNAGKLNTHWWFFMALSRYLFPRYCIQMDAGSVPTASCMHLLWSYMEEHQNVAGTASFVLTPKPPILSDIVSTWQYGHFSVEKVLVFPPEIAAGYLSILPGQFSMLRWEALYPQRSDRLVEEKQAFPLKGYFRGLRKLGLFESNMFLAEDRVIGFEILTNSSYGWKIALVPSAIVITDACQSLSELLCQRRRWINSIFTVRLWMLLKSFKYLCNGDIDLIDRFRFVGASVYHFLTALIIWFCPATIYGSTILLYTYTKSILEIHSPSLVPIIDFFLGIELFSVTTILILGQLYKKYKFILILNVASRLSFSAVIIGSLICAFLWTGYPALLNLLALCILPALIFFSIALHGQWFLKQSWKSLILYFLIDLPVWLVLQSYAFHNIHDVSWGTKGLTGGSQELKKSRQKFRNIFVCTWLLSNFTLTISIMIFPNVQTSIILLYAFYLGFSVLSGIIFNVSSMRLKKVFESKSASDFSH
ncbi:glycosyltransferase family 2 protein [Nostoc sp.]|uniref:glycosyltransferase family 2 protein n=1 Tax=Nostoc sp. TaxID=1180 RepID=UPI002FF7958D